MTIRFRVVDVEVWPTQAMVGVEFWRDGTLFDAPDLWFDTANNARAFFAEATKRGWVAPPGVVMEPYAAAAMIADLAGAMGGEWWEGGPFWGPVPTEE